MEEYENDRLNEVIERGLVRVENSSSSEDYCNNVKAVTGLIEARNQQNKIQFDYYVKNDENANKADEIVLEQKRLENDSKWQNKVNPNTVLTCVTGVILTGATIMAEKTGMMVRPTEIGRMFLNTFFRRTD